MKKIILFTAIALKIAACGAQTTYADSMKQYFEKYVAEHEVVKGDDRKQIRFYDVNEQYRVSAQFKKTEDASWFLMPTSGPIKKFYRVYGILRFRIKDSLVQMNLYQSQDLLRNDTYKEYLFLPFTDATTGTESYEGGRYIDLTMKDIRDNRVTIDFNRAYNPYCAYVSGRYNCPIPPKENHLPVAILAGEKAYRSQ
jgi:uncharacterized protein (DUF1684 family)